MKTLLLSTGFVAMLGLATLTGCETTKTTGDKSAKSCSSCSTCDKGACDSDKYDKKKMDGDKAKTY